MSADDQKNSQVHVRVSAEFKRALKVFCAREGTTEQSLVVELLEKRLAKQAPDLWSAGTEARSGRRGKREARG